MKGSGEQGQALFNQTKNMGEELRLEGVKGENKCTYHETVGEEMERSYDKGHRRVDRRVLGEEDKNVLNNFQVENGKDGKANNGG